MFWHCLSLGFTVSAVCVLIVTVGPAGYIGVYVGRCACRYELFAVVSHKGRSSSAGHYMGWARASGDDWFCFDDDAVSPCKTEHVKALKGGGALPLLCSGGCVSYDLG